MKGKVVKVVPEDEMVAVDAPPVTRSTSTVSTPGSPDSSLFTALTQ